MQAITTAPTDCVHGPQQALAIFSVSQLAQVRQVIHQHIGIVVADSDLANLIQILQERLADLRLGTIEDYVVFLQSPEMESEPEWALLANRLRVGESYFLRDSGQMTLLETVVLPEILQRNQHTHTVRLLSAGCSTGEEAYSLAILLDRILYKQAAGTTSLLGPVAWDNWDIKILGVDIDAQALATAQLGLYPEWSFRRVPVAIKDAYFTKQSTPHWQIHPHIKSKVDFARLNLLESCHAAGGIQMAAMDLIVCRNVFIYFHAKTIACLVDKFANTLAPHGYLLTGHGELYGIKPPLLEVRSFATSVIYQRPSMEEVRRALPQTVPIETQPTAATHLPAVASTYKPLTSHTSRVSHKTAQPHGKYHLTLPPHRVVKKSAKTLAIPTQTAATVEKMRDSVVVNVSKTVASSTMAMPPSSNGTAPSSTIAELRALLQQGSYSLVIAIATSALRPPPQDIEGWQMLAQAYANLGQIDAAKFCCTHILTADAFYAPAYYIMAHLALEQGDAAQRLRLLKKALYLEHNFLAPMLELAEIYAHSGQLIRAKKLRKGACKVLESLPSSTPIAMLEDWTAHRLLAQVRKLC